MPDRLIVAARRTAAQVRGEATIEDAAYTALVRLAETARRQLDSSGMDPAVLDSRHPTWQHVIDATLLPALARVFTRAYEQGVAPAARAALTSAAEAVEPFPDPGLSMSNAAAERHLLGVRNRLVNVSDTVYRLIVTELAAGREARTVAEDGAVGIGESIPQLAARVDALLSDTQRWRNRAVTIARTETIGANNGGYQAAAADSARILGHSEGEVAKEWLATSDARTRETHAEANGQVVIGLGSPFYVGGAALAHPGDPSGPAEEVINCRCTTLYHYPGDPDYPALAASLSTPRAGVQHTEPARRQEQQMTQAPVTDPNGPPDDVEVEPLDVVVVALPAADDSVNGIGDGQKHATLLFFGNLPGSGGDAENPGLTPDFKAAIEQAVSDLAGMTPPISSAVSGVDSLGPDGARVWLLDDALTAVRTALVGVQGVQTVLDGVTQYPSFTPHVTIGYPDTAPADAEDETDDDAPDADDTGPDAAPADTDPLAPDVESAAAEVTSISFDRLAVWWVDEQTEFDLTGSADTAPAPKDDTQPVPGTAAGVLEAFARQLSANGGIDFDTALAALTSTYADVAAPEAAPAPAGTPAKAQDIAPDGDPFYGIAWPEDTLSGDGRAIAREATVWRDLPLPVMAQEATAVGHDGAVRVGRIDEMVRDDTTYAVPVIRYSGVWDTSPAAVETERQVENRIVRGISVDGDAVTVELRGSDGAVLDPMVDDFPADGVVIEVATEARVAGGTVCSIPAFQQAYIANGTLADRADPEPGWNADGTPKDNTLDTPPTEGTPEGEDFDKPVAASAWSLVAAAAPPVWPADDFANPGLTEPTRLTVTDDGRVYGHLAVWGVCHIGIDGMCQEAPVSHADYAYFATGRVQTTDGLLPVGQLTMGTGHAAMNLRGPAAVAHYDNTGTAVADVAIGQDGLGIWFAGRIRPGVTPEQVYAMRAAGSVSGDWRDIGTGLELVAALVVNVPGFPIPAPAVAASGSEAYTLVASGVVPPPREKPRTPGDFRTDPEFVRAVATTALLMMRREQAADRLIAVRRRHAAARLQRGLNRRRDAAAARLIRKG